MISYVLNIHLYPGLPENLSVHVRVSVCVLATSIFVSIHFIIQNVVFLTTYSPINTGLIITILDELYVTVNIMKLIFIINCLCEREHLII